MNFLNARKPYAFSHVLSIRWARSKSSFKKTCSILNPFSIISKTFAILRWKITAFLPGYNIAEKLQSSRKLTFFVPELGHIYNLRNWNVRFKKTYFVRLLTKIRVRQWMSCCERIQIFVTKKQKRPHGWESILPSAIFSPLLFYARNLIHLWTKIILVTKILRRHFETTVIYHLEMSTEQSPLISKWQSYIISKRDRDFCSFRRDSHLLFRRDSHILSKG